MTLRQRSSLWIWLLGLGAAVGIGFGVLVSFNIVLAVFGLEADTTHSLMLWDGVANFGLSWIAGWKFTQDNWLLSLLPLHFLAFWLFGAKVSIVIVSGWLIYVGAAFCTAAIAWCLGARFAAAPIAMVLTNLPLFAHVRGFASYSTSHNITNLLGLLSLLALVGWLAWRSTILLFLILTLLIAGSVSDPWMLASYVVPLGIFGIGLAARPACGIHRSDGLRLAVVCLLAYMAVRTKLFGTLIFLPDASMGLGSLATMKHNFAYLLRELAGLIISFSAGGGEELPSALETVVVLVVVLALCGLATGALAASSRKCHQALWPLSLVGFLSIGVVSLAFVGMRDLAQPYSARFLINVPYLLVLLAATACEMTWSFLAWPIRYAIPVCLALCTVCNASSMWRYAERPSLQLRPSAAYANASFLLKSGLTYGYGPYWGGRIYASSWASGSRALVEEGWGANVLTVASGFRLRVRPVSFDPPSGYLATGIRPAVARAWYSPSDIPQATRQFFAIVAPDLEECPDLDLCIRGLEKQFGPPVRTLHKGQATILVWVHDLLEFEGPPLRVARGRRYLFNDRGEFPAGRGWSRPESWGVWSDGPTASLLLDMAGIVPPPSSVTIRAQAFLSDKIPRQTVALRFADELIGTLQFDRGFEEQIYSVKIPPELASKLTANVHLEFRIGQPRSPQELGLSADPRKLGIGLMMIEFD